MATIIERLSGKGPAKKSGVSRREFLKSSGVGAGGMALFGLDDVELVFTEEVAALGFSHEVAERFSIGQYRGKVYMPIRDPDGSIVGVDGSIRTLQTAILHPMGTLTPLDAGRVAFQEHYLILGLSLPLALIFSVLLTRGIRRRGGNT